MVTACSHLATMVYGRKGGNTDRQAIYIDDGVYGSFNIIMTDHATLHPILFKEVSDNEPKIPTTVFGPTCDGLDQVCYGESTSVPRLEEGDWLYWDDMGAYTHCAPFTFNGYTNVPKKTYIYRI